jgi:hypothetical protein
VKNKSLTLVTELSDDQIVSTLLSLPSSMLQWTPREKDIKREAIRRGLAVTSHTDSRGN